MRQDCPFLAISNALLRADGVSGTPPSPFARPNQTLDFWVFELPSPVQDVAEWYTQTTQILSSRTELIQQVQGNGGELTLFVEFASAVLVLRLDVVFLRLLTGLGISLECAFVHAEDMPVVTDLIAELDRRMTAYRKDPTRITTWEATKARLQGSKSE